MKQITDDEITKIDGILAAIKARGDIPVIVELPKITVTSPKTGTVWKRGSNQMIAWTSSNTTGSVRISLLKSGVEIGVIATSVPVTAGAFQWVINPDIKLVTGSDFRIGIDTGSVSGVSETFSLTPSVDVPPVTQPPSNGYGAGANNTGSPIGGSIGYTKIVKSGMIVNTAAQLVSALESAGQGDIIFVPGNLTIDLTGYHNIYIERGVTLASDRGNMSPGALLTRKRISGDETYSAMQLFDAGAGRITGLRIQGPDMVEDQKFDEPPYLRSAIHCKVNGFELDNCEVWGWSYCGVKFEGARLGNVHHNFIHHCNSRGYGYGVCIAEGGQVLIEANMFDNTRHAIASMGGATDDYEARYNIHLGNGNCYGGHHFDIHSSGVAGGTTYIHHNTFKPSSLVSLGIRACPRVFCTVTKNIFEKSWDGAVGFERCASLQNINMTDNMIEGKVKNTVALWHE